MHEATLVWEGRLVRFVLAAVLAFFALAGSVSAAPVQLGAGDNPGLALDAAGTAYIAWRGVEADPTSLQFCRLPRGAAACQGQRVLTAQGTSLSRPHVSVSGNVVRIVQYRYSVVPPQTFVFTSSDGGDTFDAGRSAGQAPIEEAVFGTDGTVTGATTAWSNGGVVQQLPLATGTAGGSWAQLFATDALYNGSVAYTPDGRLIAIFADASGNAFFRVQAGGATNANDAGTWGAAVPIGYAPYPHLASGPNGLFLLAGNDTSGVSARTWNGTSFGAATVLAAVAEEPQAHLTVDPGGRLHAVYSRFDVDGVHLVHAVSDDGGTWSQGSLLVQPGLPKAPRVAAAADHVGVAVWSTDGAIFASALGPNAPAAPAQPPPQPPPAPPEPQFNRTVVVTPSGTVRVRLPGAARFVPLTTLDDVPFGATIDAKRGAVVLRARTRRGGPIETVRLFDGIFRINQSGDVVSFTLTEALATCPRRGSAAANQKKPKSRKLWGDGKGSFRTTGRYSAATVRGTRWLVQDTCKGTLTRVTQGSVFVRDKVRGRTIVVRKGRSYTARPRR